MFSKACEYGIRAIIHIAVLSQDEKRVGLKEIAKEIGSPEAFTAKILQILSKNDLVESTKGPTGGFEMSVQQMKKIKLSDVVFAIDGDSIYKGCGLGMKECSEKHPCPVHEKFKTIRNELKKMLENTSIYNLAIDQKNGLTFLKR
ncbi:Rrf2 family transcriptional regulator [uncultured Cytophaga sp.]|uniref:RrF2 family transcriptional regulator n=1 Tax=uncultured Cytophaga sp. TaxID=160238 RepID=UPI00262A587E|nr:Rrf2 family transcriptional regulator [uncultured Cytophaga sp.]